MKIKILKKPDALLEGKNFPGVPPYPNMSGLSPFGEINSNTTGTTDDQITDTVTPVDREDATIEAEKGEVIVSPGLLGMYKIGGNTHTRGGTPLAAKPGSFIFSNDKNLFIDKKERDLFNFKSSKDSKGLNTPAKVIQREVKPKDYNRHVSILQDSNSDNIAKNTALLMLEKYQEKLGQVAFLQEAKKGLPQGEPSFSKGTAPVKDEALMKEENTQKMFALGGPVDPNCPCGRYPDGTCMPCDDAKKWDPYITSASKMKSTPGNGYNPVFNNDQGQLYQKYLPGQGTPRQHTPEEEAAYMKWLNTKPLDERNRVIQANVKAGQTKANPNDQFAWVPNANTPVDSLQRTANPIDMGNGRPGVHAPTFNTQGEDVGQIPWEGFNFQMNPLEKLTTAAPFLTALTMPTYYDMLSQKYTPNIRLDRLDNTKEINSIQESSNLGQKELFANQPGGQAYLNSGQLRAREIEAMGRSNAGLDQANTQIANQEAMSNYQGDVADDLYNLQNIHSTYNNNVLSRQRRSEQLANGATQSLNNAVDIRQNLDTLGQAATAAAIPYLTTMKDKFGNEQYVTGPDGKRYSVQGVPFGFNANRLPRFQPGFGDLNSFGVNQISQGNTGALNAAMEDLQKAISTGDTDRINALSRSIYALSRNNAQQVYQNPLYNVLSNMRKPYTP